MTLLGLEIYSLIFSRILFADLMESSRVEVVYLCLWSILNLFLLFYYSGVSSSVLWRSTKGIVLVLSIKPFYLKLACLFDGDDSVLFDYFLCKLVAFLILLSSSALVTSTWAIKLLSVFPSPISTFGNKFPIIILSYATQASSH